MLSSLDITKLLSLECVIEGYNFYTGMRIKLGSTGRCRLKQSGTRIKKFLGFATDGVG